MIECTLEKHASEILEILNDAIVHSTALYDYRPRAPESMAAWFKAKEAGRFPVIGMAGEDGRLLGFATYGTFRNWPAYKYSVENSVYVHRDQHRRGIARLLMEHLIDRARASGFHSIIARVEASGEASRALHAAVGFELVGIEREVGRKFNRWLSVAVMQLML